MRSIHQISTLIYAFNSSDEVLLLERTRFPNVGLWSPFGGKLETNLGESPHQSAVRETYEEIGQKFSPSDFHLTGILSERGFDDQAHWLMFLFELKARLTDLPPAHAEGQYGFFARKSLADLKLPETDRQFIWPLFWQHRGGFFSARCQTEPMISWEIEESVPAHSKKAE